MKEKFIVSLTIAMVHIPLKTHYGSITTTFMDYTNLTQISNGKAQKELFADTNLTDKSPLNPKVKVLI